MKSLPGTYALILRGHSSAAIDVGRWGRLRLRPGYYVYVGSAFGPGGVRARVARHFRATRREHWHIDYIRALLEPVRAWCSYASDRLEHEWARSFGMMAGASCIRGFGSSDCDCDGHLFVLPRAPDIAAFRGAVDESIEMPEYRRASDEQ